MIIFEHAQDLLRSMRSVFYVKASWEHAELIIIQKAAKSLFAGTNVGKTVTTVETSVT